MIKFTKNQSPIIGISRVTLQALTASFYDNNGENMSPIIDDLAHSGMDRDLAAFNVTLLLKHPEFCDLPEEDKTIRCSSATLSKGSRWGDNITVYEFKAYSVLHSKVEFVSRTFNVYNEEYKEHPNTIEPISIAIDHMSYEKWKHLSTTIPPILLEHINDEDHTFIERPAE